MSPKPTASGNPSLINMTGKNAYDLTVNINGKLALRLKDMVIANNIEIDLPFEYGINEVVFKYGNDDRYVNSGFVYDTRDRKLAPIEQSKLNQI